MINRLLLDALRYIRDVGPIHRDVGICTNVGEILLHNKVQNADGYKSEVMSKLYGMFYDWPLANNESGFPVGGSVQYYAEKHEETLWTNPRRIELLNWLIMQLENE